MRRVVIESPFSGDVADNIAYAMECVHDCLKRGEAPYASHLFFTQPGLLDDEDPEQRMLSIRAGLVWGDTAELVAVYADHGISSGMELGIQAAIARGTPVEYRYLNVEAKNG